MVTIVTGMISCKKKEPVKEEPQPPITEEPIATKVRVTNLTVNPPLTVDPPHKIMHLSFDDAYHFLIDLDAKKNSYKSIFENPLLGKLKSYHDKYGVVFSLYCFTYSPGLAWNIKPLPISFAEEFRDNSDWLKLGFHSRNSGYTAADWKVKYYSDFLSVIPEIEGREKCFDLVPRLHTFGLNTTIAYCDSLRDANPGLMGFLSTDDTRNSYYLTTAQSYYINHNDSLYDTENNLYFFRSETRLEAVKSMVPFLAQFLTPAFASRANIMPVFTHEYAVYNAKLGLLDKGLFEKIDTCITWAIQNNYKFDFPMNIIKKYNPTGTSGKWSIRENLQSGDVLYGDRTYAIAELPASLKGSVWIRTANDSSSLETVGSDLATFKIDKDADVYIAHLDGITPKPDWLSSWVKETASDMFILTNESPAQRYSIYKKRFTAGSTVAVGLNGSNTRNMYSIIVK
jgi:hypothetical protein